MESIEELRKICQSAFLREQANPYGRFIRIFSIYLTRFLIPTRMTPNGVSGIMILVGSFATLFFLVPSREMYLSGAILLQFWYTLDGVDGELARYRHYQRTGSMIMDKRDGGVTGAYIDIVNHYMINFLVPLTISFGLFQKNHSSLWIVIGGLASLGQVLMLALHDARARSMMTHLKRFNHVRILKESAESKKPGEKDQSRSIAKYFFIALHHTLIYPAVMNLVGISAIMNFLMPAWEWRTPLLLYFAFGTAMVSAGMIARNVLTQSCEGELKSQFQLSDKPLP